MKMRPLWETVTPVGMAPWNCATGSSAPHARSVASSVNCAVPTEVLLMRLHHDLDAIVLFFPEHGISLRSLIERHAVRDHEARIDLAFLNSFEQGLHIALHMRLSGAHGEGAIHEGS